MNEQRRILFTVIPEKGHINPYIGVAKHLRENGCEVGFYAPKDISGQLKAAGLDCFIGEYEQGLPPDGNRGKEFARNVRDSQWLRGWIKELLIERAPDAVPALRRAISRFRPSIVVTDPMIYPAAVAAEREGLKWIAVSNSLNPVLDDSIQSELLETVQWLSADREAFFRENGMNLRFSGCDMISPYLTIAFTTEEFIGRSVSGVEMVGPSIPKGQRGDELEFPWDRLERDMPVIYMSLGSQIYYQPRMFRTVFEAVRGKPVQLVATVNELMNVYEPGGLKGEIPENVILAYYTPQLKLLSKVSAMITHGGANSVMEALYFRVPMLITPICNDQFHQARFIRQQGVGIELNLDKAGVAECWAGIQQLLESTAIRKNISRISASYETDGAFNAARMILAMLKTE